MDSKKLREQGESLYTKRLSLMGLWQEIAENFYVERADFTFRRDLGDEYAAHLTTSYPILARRELTDQMSTMLRNTEREWFHMITGQVMTEDQHEEQMWMETATRAQRLAMYDTSSMFVRASKEADADYASFGNAVEQVKLNVPSEYNPKSHLVYRCWHLRDCVWIEDADGKIVAVWRRWKPTVLTLCSLFDGKQGKSVDSRVKSLYTRGKLFEEIHCMHMMVRADMWDGTSNGKPWVSIYYDCQHEHEMEAVAQWSREYNISRWQTVSGSQYAFSPCTVAALPESRLLQSMTYTLLEAGEKAVNPPLVGAENVVRSDVNIFAGGMTWVDREYDERMGPALRALVSEPKLIPFGADMAEKCRALLHQCFYLNKLTLPQRGPEMTAYEVGQRIQEYVRGALPLFEPMETERNGGICELTFDLLLRNGGFGALQDIPEKLRGTDIKWRFSSPLHDTIDEAKSQKFVQLKEIIAIGAALDKNVAAIPDAVTAVRDALKGAGIPTNWTRSRSQVDELVQKAQGDQAAAASLAQMQQGADVAKTAAEAGKSMAETDALAA